MLKIVSDVIAFHKAGESPVLDTPKIPSPDRVKLRKSLIREEVDETLKAIDDGDLVEVADGIADAIYVLVGTALEFGIDLTAVWNEVQRSNMSKFPPCERCHGEGGFLHQGNHVFEIGGTGLPIGRTPDRTEACVECEGRGTQLILREDGKVLKPESWSPPDIKSVMES